MKLKTIGLTCFLTFVGINVSAFSLMADDRRSDNANVSFGLWDPNKDDLNGAPWIGWWATQLWEWVLRTSSSPKGSL